MALRDYYSLSDTLAQPDSGDLSTDTHLVDSETSIDLLQPSFVIPNPIPPASDAALSSQSLAQEMEQCRKKLLNILFKHPETFQLITTEFEQSFTEGVDYSLTGNGKNQSNKVVQNPFLVQLVTNESVTVNKKNENFVTDTELKESNLHIFPAVLIRLAEQAETVANLELSYRQELRKARRQLQNTRQKMIVNNTGLVAFVAHKHKTINLSFDDLMQEGSIGLIRAVDRFDAERGICFSTYAIFWIKQAISRLIVKQEKVVRLPVALAEKASALFEIMRNYYLENQRWPTFHQLHAQCNLSDDEIKIVSSYYQATHSLDASLSEESDDDHTLMDSMQQHQFPSPLNELIDDNLAKYLVNSVASLPENEANILNMRFGLQNQSEMTLQAIADQLNVTRERVRQIQNQALKKLKQQFGCELMPFLETNDH